MLRRLAVVTALAIVALLGSAAPAWAHVELDPEEAVAGSVETLTFSFHHGKDGAATTALEVQLPAGTEVLDMEDAEGFTGTHNPSGGIVRWEGGSVPDGVAAEFSITVILPTTPGVALFPTIQETEAGELAWIDEEEGEGEDSNPAPRVTLTADPNATTTTAPSPSTTDAPTTTADLPGTTLEAANQGDDGSAAPWLIGAGIAAIVAIAVGGTLLKRHAAKGESTDEPGGDVTP